jgi:hypothetical protein
MSFKSRAGVSEEHVVRPLVDQVQHELQEPSEHCLEKLPYFREWQRILLL